MGEKNDEFFEKDNNKVQIIIEESKDIIRKSHLNKTYYMLLMLEIGIFILYQALKN